LNTPGSRALVVYARDPERGRVKTRLQPRFAPEQALRLHEAMLSDTLDAMRVACEGLATLWLSWSAAPRHAFRADAEAEGILQEIQAGAGLGDRMRNTLERRVAEGCTRTLLIGSDTPHLEPARIREAFAALDHHHVIVGPAEDGGYYLLGARCVHPALFEGIPWGGPEVLSLTRAALRKAGLSWHELPVLFDVDTARDARRLWSLASGHPGLSRTRAVLEETFGSAAGSGA
jgi:rSAM/selenodomain-associated transferase 1